MKKFLLSAVVVMLVVALSVSPAYATSTRSPTEPDRSDRPVVEIEDQPVPWWQGLGDHIGWGSSQAGSSQAGTSQAGPAQAAANAQASNGSLLDGLLDIFDQDVPLAFLPSPQTGVTGLTGTETLALLSVVFTASGMAVLGKAWKQAGSVR